MVQILNREVMAIIEYLPKTKRIDKVFVDPLTSVDYEDEDTWYFDESNMDEFYTVISRETVINISQNNLTIKK